MKVKYREHIHPIKRLVRDIKLRLRKNSASNRASIAGRFSGKFLDFDQSEEREKWRM
jgi:hypothetical protein